MPNIIINVVHTGQYDVVQACQPAVTMAAECRAFLCECVQVSIAVNAVYIYKCFVVCEFALKIF